MMALVIYYFEPNKRTSKLTKRLLKFTVHSDPQNAFKNVILLPILFSTLKLLQCGARQLCVCYRVFVPSEKKGRKDQCRGFSPSSPDGRLESSKRRGTSSPRARRRGGEASLRWGGVATTRHFHPPAPYIHAT